MTEVLGRPVNGDIVRRERRRSTQRSGEEFLAELDTLLDIEGVEAVRWSQYTPYFNDGDACDFGVGEPRVKVVGDDESGDWEDGFVEGFHTGYYDYDTRRYVENPIPEDRVVVEAALRQFSLGFWDFEQFLEESFGDHATVTATREGFDVEYYEHD